MKRIFTFVFCMFFVYFTSAQQFHTSSNAVSISNETNSTNGWNALANLQSVNDNPQDGNLCFLVSSTATNDREISYTLNAPVGATLQISIWARLGAQNNRPAFANWTGFNGFSTTPINTTNWALYEWTLVVTNATQVIRVYTSPRTGGSEGDAVYLDGVSITGPDVSDTEAPTVPTGLQANSVTETSFNVSWNPSTDDTAVTGYEVFIDGTSAGTTTTENFDATGLNPDNTYAVTVTAFDAAGNTSAASTPIQVTTLSNADTQAPSVPAGLQANLVTETSFNVSWNPSTDDTAVTGYEVFIDGTSAGTTTTENFDATGLNPDNTYAVTVTAFDAAGNTSAASAPIQVTTLAPSGDTEAPSVPVGVEATGITANSFDVIWQASTDNTGVTGYEVFLDGTSAGITSATTLQVTALAAATTYQVTVTARDGAGNVSAASTPLEVTTLSAGDTEVPGRVNDLTSSNITTSSVNLTWSNPGDNVGVVNYELLLNGSSWGFTGLVESFVLNGLTADTNYTIRIRAYDDAGNIGAWSNTLNITTQPATGGITDYTSENANLPEVDWQANNIFVNGSLGIGAQPSGLYRLAVAGNIVSEEVRVALQADWPDYVFSPEYNLPSLKEVNDFINTYGHLPNVPSAEEVEDKGIMLGNMNAVLLRKIEELTLYVINQQKELDSLKHIHATREQVVRNRLEQLEKKLPDEKY